jgi:nucleotide-binding universal stress UspA family protein
MYSKILLPTDGSENAERAGRHALWIADKTNAEIMVLNVFEPPNMAVLPISVLPGTDEGLYKQLMEEGHNIAVDFTGRLQKIKEKGSYQDIKISAIVREGKAYNEILKTTTEEDIDLVVMGASGRHGLDRIALGSVTERVVRGSKTPVLVIP